MLQTLPAETLLSRSIRLAVEHALAIGERDLALRLAFIRETMTRPVSADAR